MALAKFAYGAVFVVLLPALLLVWERLTRTLIATPAYGNATLAGFVGVGGGSLFATGMWQLWRRGGGVPMNVFPPPRLVTSGLFAWIPHPIYTGFTLLVWAASIYSRSASGLWLITPIVALGCASLVVGYERGDLRERFGDAWARAGLMLPPDSPRRALKRERARTVITVLGPWLALYEATVWLMPRAHAFAVPFPGEDRLPVMTWTEAIYESAFVVVGLTPFLVREASVLRRFSIQGWIAIIVVFTICWTVPTLTPDQPVIGDGWLARVLAFESAHDPPTNALPSFHALWAILAASAIVASRPGWRWVAWTWAVLMSASCVTTRMHYATDVIAAWLIAPAILRYERSWNRIRRAAEAIANSWREWRLGGLRIINHGFYAGLGVFVGLGLITAATGPTLAGPVLITLLGGIAGAGLWAQWVEGSPRLLRPFGFYGGLLGVLLTCAVLPNTWLLLAAHSLAGPWVQGLGRLRCLVQGCCHGAPAAASVGIVYRREESRVVRIAHLGGVPVHATPLYSMLWSVFTGLMLMRLWICGARLNLICAVWLMLNGLGRFAEERYRGEPQTRIFAGLRLYQWLAIASVLGGIGLSCVAGLPEAPPLTWANVNLPLALAGFALTSVALGVDFPHSNRRFARLT